MYIQKKGMGRSAESHYPTMSVDDICALPVGDLADKKLRAFSLGDKSLFTGRDFCASRMGIYL